MRKAVAFACGIVAAGIVFWSPARSQEAPAAPRENVMKACGDKWRAVREAETAKGVTWPQYLSRCRAETSAVRTGASAAEGKADGAKAGAAGAVPADKPAAAVVTGKIVFPDHVAPRHASERPALARQRTCADQFKANKATGGNAGLKWIERGGGYWSRCNAHLKQTRA
jgi:hypothetical protein